MIAIFELNKFWTNISILSIIIYKRNYQQMLYLVILLKVNKNLKLYFYYTILTFYLDISSKIKNYKKLVLNIKKVI